MRVGISCDHGGFELKEYLILALRNVGYEVVDFGAKELDPEDDFPDFVIPMARAVAGGECWSRGFLNWRHNARRTARVQQ